VEAAEPGRRVLKDRWVRKDLREQQDQPDRWGQLDRQDLRALSGQQGLQDR
jgi:hypothetical protein